MALRPQQPPRRRAARATQSVVVLLGLAALGLARWHGDWEWQLMSQPRQSPDDSSGEGGSSSGGAAAAAPRRRSDAPTRQRSGAVPDDVKRRCEGTLGSWCVDYLTQEEVPAVLPPVGNETCSLDCNKVGVCSALSGLCACPAGWTGFNCLQPLKRYCTHKYRNFGFDFHPEPANLSAGVGPARHDTFQFTSTHCAGYCDYDVAACFCPSNTTFGRIPPPEDAPLGSPPVRRGRPLADSCQPNKLPDGTPTAWGTVDPAALFGPDGWCNAAEPQQQCACYQDGWAGRNCEEPVEQFCLNQCNGRGECSRGFCKCDPGWHGLDCAHRGPGADDASPGREAARPWIETFVHTPAARRFEPGETRRRPLIFVYELAADYGTLLLQYKHGAEGCQPRAFGLPGNASRFTSTLYNLETGFLEALLQSGHRTLDPEEADFFYVPTFPSCFIEWVWGGADSLRDHYYGVHQSRTQSSTNLLLEAYHWLKAHQPYWNRRGGRDHIWLVTFDEASCHVPAAIRPSIILSQWGRKDLNHTSGTGYWQDEYSNEFTHPQWEPDGFLHKIAGHPCYDPAKDLVLPSMKPPAHFHASPLLGAPTRNRTWLAFHKGRVQPGNPTFSRGIRQRLAKAAKEGGWREKHGIICGEWDEVPGDYSELLASSVFCLMLPGDGWSARMEDAALHGCIPVIILDEVDMSFESILDYSRYALRIPEADAEKLPELLAAVPEGRRREMRTALARVWQRYYWGGWRPFAASFREAQAAHNAAAAGGEPPPLSEPARRADLDPAADDAFATVMAWLYSRIDATR